MGEDTRVIGGGANLLLPLPLGVAMLAWVVMGTGEGFEPSAFGL